MIANHKHTKFFIFVPKKTQIKPERKEKDFRSFLPHRDLNLVCQILSQMTYQCVSVTQFGFYFLKTVDQFSLLSICKML